MKVFVVLAAILATAAAASLGGEEYMEIAPFQPDGRIIGGERAATGQFPYQVGLSIGTVLTSWCGGSLISDEWVVTAAHCLDGKTTVTVYLGGTALKQGTAIKSAKLIVHEKYDSSNIVNDIGLIKLASPVKFSSVIQPVELPSDDSANYQGKEVTASGWGKTSDQGSVADNLYYIYRTVAANSVCSKRYGSGSVKDSNICLETNTDSTYKSTCNGDSGGPLVLKNTYHQIGLTSYGAAAGCEKGYPVVFTRVSSYRSWIKANSGV